MSDGAGPGVVERARSAASRGDWQQAFGLLMEAGTHGLLVPADVPVLGEAAYAAGHLRYDRRGVGADYAACLQARRPGREYRVALTSSDRRSTPRHRQGTKLVVWRRVPPLEGQRSFFGGRAPGLLRRGPPPKRIDVGVEPRRTVYG